MKMVNGGLAMLDKLDNSLCRLGVAKVATFKDVLEKEYRALYAGRLSRQLPQYSTHFGLTPYFPSSRNIDADVTQPMLLPDDCIDAYQAEDVFEHVDYETLTGVFDEIHRILKPGGVFRLSVPDYRFDQYQNRSLKNEDGEVVFDPGGGGKFENGRVLDGGHLWFPTYELVADLFRRSSFGAHGAVSFLHYNASDGSYVMQPIDHARGRVQRVPEHDARVASRPRPISIVVDAVKNNSVGTGEYSAIATN